MMVQIVSYEKTLFARLRVLKVRQGHCEFYMFTHRSSEGVVDYYCYMNRGSLASAAASYWWYHWMPACACDRPLRRFFKPGVGGTLIPTNDYNILGAFTYALCCIVGE